MIEFFQEALHRLHQRLRPRWAGEGGRPPPQQPEASGESSDDEYNLPLRPFNRYKGAMQDKRTLSGVVTVVNHENQFCLVNNEVIVKFSELGEDVQLRVGLQIDVGQSRWTNGAELAQGWANIFVFATPPPLAQFEAMVAKFIKYIDFERHIAFLDDSELICDIADVGVNHRGTKVYTYSPRVGDFVMVPQQVIPNSKVLSGVRPATMTNRSGTITFWDRKRELGRVNGNINFNRVDCFNWHPRTNDEVVFIEIPNRKGPRAIEVTKFRGAAASRRRPVSVKSADQRRFVFKGPRPNVVTRRDAPPHFLPNFDVPLHLVNGIRQGTDILQIVPELIADLTPENYREKMTALLYCEEVALGIEVGAYTIRGKQLEHLYGNRFMIEVPGLKFDSPRLSEADRIVITAGDDATIEFHAFVHSVRQGSSIVFEMSDVFTTKHKTVLVDVTFTLNRFPLRTMHDALRSVGREIQHNTLFPTYSNFVHRDSRRFHWTKDYPQACAMITGLNMYQNEAVKSVLDGAGLIHPKVIFGPAGTGKTRTIVELARVILSCSTATILIVTPSNAAADIVITRLAGVVELPSTYLCRWNALRRVDETLPDPVATLSVDSLAKTARCVVSTCLASASLPRRKFDFLLVDEAAQCTEPETLVAMRYCQSAQVVLAGDPAQLGPIVKSPYGAHFGLTCSLLSRLLTRPPYQREHGSSNRLYLTKLLLNYRSHPKLLEITSKLFYGGEMAAKARIFANLDCYLDVLPCAGIPFVLADVKNGTESRQTGSFSWFNAKEVVKTLEYARKVIQCGLKPTEIGIISPYRLRCKIWARYDAEGIFFNAPMKNSYGNVRLNAQSRLSEFYTWILPTSG